MARESSGSRPKSGLGDVKSTGSRWPWGRDFGRRIRRRRLPLRASAKSWDGHVCDMQELANSPGFQRLRAEIITLAGLSRSDRVLDVGAGTGLLTLAAARDAAHVTALDISPSMCRHLEAKLARCAIDNVDVRVGTASELPLGDGSIDVILSNYCFHHLRDPDKRRALSEAIRVLRPGGRFVAGDMMFQIGLTHARDRAVMARFAGRMLRRGPAGLMRLLKNLPSRCQQTRRASRQHRLVAGRAQRGGLRRRPRAIPRARGRNCDRAPPRTTRPDARQPPDESDFDRSSLPQLTLLRPATKARASAEISRPAAAKLSESVPRTGPRQGSTLLLVLVSCRYRCAKPSLCFVWLSEHVSHPADAVDQRPRTRRL